MDEHDHENDPDWAGVHFHRHPDGSGHLVIDVDPVQERPWWRQPAVYKLFSYELALSAVWTGAGVTNAVVNGVTFFNIGAPVALWAVTFLAMTRAVMAHRVGFRMGMEALTVAMAQKTPKIAAQVVQRSGELWDPPPAAVAHTLEIERLERDINRDR